MGIDALIAGEWIGFEEKRIEYMIQVSVTEKALSKRLM